MGVLLIFLTIASFVSVLNNPLVSFEKPDLLNGKCKDDLSYSHFHLSLTIAHIGHTL
jgi:hypothetical protein